MAKRVKHHEMKSPGLRGVRRPDRPFTENEIKQLIQGFKIFSLTHDGDYLYLWVE